MSVNIRLNQYEIVSLSLLQYRLMLVKSVDRNKYFEKDHEEVCSSVVSSRLDRLVDRVDWVLTWEFCGFVRKEIYHRRVLEYVEEIYRIGWKDE